MRTGFIALAAVALAALGGCRNAAAPAAYAAGPPEHVLVILVDTMRADHLGAYGYHRNTSPVIDRLAAEGVVFDNARANSTYTGEVVSALFSGVLPTVNPEGTGWYARPWPGRANIAQRFDAAGYQTACFTNSPVLSMPGYFEGFDEAQNYALDYAQPPMTAELTERVRDFMTRHKDGKTFTYLHYIEPHTPYIAPNEYVARFEDPPPPKRMNMSVDVQGHLEELMAEGFGPGDPRFEDLILRYDAEIAMTDDHIGRLLDGLEEAGMLDDTLVVITADHGEEFLEHGYFEHAWTVYDEVLRVPLIFWRPGMLEPGRRADAVSLVDLLPTLLAFIELPGQADDFNGMALFKQGAGGAWVDHIAARPVYASLLTETRSLLHTVVEGDLKYIAAARYLTPADCDVFYRQQRILRETLGACWKRYDYWQPARQEMLFNIAEDPKETRNLATALPRERDRMRALLKDLKARSQRADTIRYVDEDALTVPFVEQLTAGCAAGMDVPPSASTPTDEPTQAQIDALEALGYMGSDEDESNTPAAAPAP